MWFERRKKKTQVAASLGSNASHNRPSWDGSRFPGQKMSV